MPQTPEELEYKKEKRKLEKRLHKHSWEAFREVIGWLEAGAAGDLPAKQLTAEARALAAEMARELTNGLPENRRR